MNMYKKCFGLLMISLVSCLAHASDEMPTLTLTASKTEIAPGDTVTLTASLTGWDEEDTGVSANKLYSGVTLKSKYSEATMFDNLAPYRWTIDSSLENSGKTTYQAVVLFLDQVIVSPEVTILVKPSEADIKTVSFADGEALYLDAGESRSMRISGLFNDGYQRDITDVGTTFSTQTPDGEDGSSIAEISLEGSLVAKRQGIVDVVATFGTEKAYRRVTVTGMTNHNPVAGEYILSINTNQVGNTVNVLSLASDADEDSLSVVQYDEKSSNGGVISYEGEGVFSYRPAEGFKGADSFSYYIGDGKDGYAEGLINIEVTSSQAAGDVSEENESASGSNGGSSEPLVLLGLVMLLSIRFKKTILS